MRWRRILAQFGKLAALFVIVPVLLIVRLRWDAILPIIIYLQLLLIWIQAEISLRQTALFAAQFEPAFDIKCSESEPATLTIENVSENPAYTLSVARVLDAHHIPLNPSLWEGKLELDRMATLAPHEKRRLCTFKDETLRNNLLTEGGALEILYFGRRGESQCVTLLFTGGQLLIVTGESLPPGVLLHTLESVSSIWRLLRFRQGLRRSGKA
jgi:hypothetical protein